MRTNYHSDQRPSYECSSRADRATTPTCRSVVAATVDTAVAAALLQALTPEQVALALSAADEVAGRHQRVSRAAQLAVERARYDADRAERAFTLVEPENRLVARTLEQRWETRLAALVQAEAALLTAQAAKPPLPEREALTALAADLPRLFNDPATNLRDRKRLLRALIADITVLPDPDLDGCRIGVRWHTGATDEITLPRAGPGRTPQAALDHIRAHGATKTSAELAAELNAAGLSTGKGHRFTTAGVARIRDTYTIPAPRTVPLHDGEISVQHAAAELGITADAITNWLRTGQAPARKGAAGRWAIPWDPATQALYRQKVAASFRLKPTKPATAGGAV
jgi:hypothetical protein